MPRIKLLVAGCSRLALRGLKETLAEETDFIIARETSTIEEAILHTKGEGPEIILLCYQLLLAAGEETIGRILYELNRVQALRHVFSRGTGVQ